MSNQHTATGRRAHLKNPLDKQKFQKRFAGRGVASPIIYAE
jgi:hypothetical protein